MKIAVATDADAAEADTSNAGARAPVFLVFTDEGDLRQTIVNPFIEESEADQEVAAMLVEDGIDMVVARSYSQAFADLLRKAGVIHVCHSGPARIAAIEAGTSE